MIQKTKILVVDDDPGIGEMLKALLEIYGYEVTLSKKPNETEAIIKEQNIDFVILDMLISGVNGTEICSRLRESEVGEEIPILMMSALHEAEEKCKKSGADGFIAKPFEIEDMLAKVNFLKITR